VTSFPADARRLILARALRGFGDGLVSVLLAGHLTALGYSPFQVGAIVTGTLFGSALLTLAVGIYGHRLDHRRVLLGASALMLATGIGFARVTAFWPLLVIAVVGTLNPSAGDVSLFLPTEQAMLAGTVDGRARTSLFAWYNLSGAFAGALGALASGLPTVPRVGFLVYAALAVLAALLYAPLPSPKPRDEAPSAAPLAESRRVVLRLAALFSLDAFGGGFVVQSLLVLWLYRRFALSVETTGVIFFASGLLGAVSQLGSSWLSARIGHVRTMVYTHLPSNALLVLTAVMPTAPLAIALLLLRTSISQMDVPARQAYVMAVVPPRERAAASSLTNVPRSLAAALPPLIAGALLARSSFGWPLICAGVLKGGYDLLLLAQFGSLPPKEAA
jgi:predicted MFS family arabinose efflux permease